MDPLTIAAVVSGGVQLITGVAGMLARSGREAEAEKLLAEARKKWGALELPDLADPDARDYYIAKSDTAEVRDSPVFQEIDARLKEISTGGETIEEQAARERGLREVRNRLAGRHEQIRNEFAARGQGGGMAEMLSRVGEEAQAAEMGNQISLDTQAQLQRRGLEALRARGGLAESQFQRDVTRAGARDALRMENARLGRTLTADRNTVAGQRYSARAQKLAGETGMDTAEAARLSELGQREAKTAVGVGEGIGTVATNIGAYYQKKKDKP